MTEQNRTTVLPLLIGNSSALLGYSDCHAEENRRRQGKGQTRLSGIEREQITRPDQQAQDRVGQSYEQRKVKGLGLKLLSIVSTEEVIIHFGS